MKTRTATFNIRALAAPEPPFTGTRIGIALGDPGSLTWGICALTLAEGHAGAVVDWGDGTCSELTESGQPTHDYAKAGEYEVRISDDVSSLAFSAKTTTSVFRLVYAPMIRSFRTTARHLATLGANCLYNAENLAEFRGEGPGPRTLDSRAFGLCPSLRGRLDFPHVDCLAANAFISSPGITELHFGAANEAAIRALPAWEASGGRFGAANATVSFDL